MAITNADASADAENSLHEFMNRDFPVIIKKSNETFTLSIKELNLNVKSKTLNSAYEELIKQKKHYFKEIIEIGEDKEILLQSEGHGYGDEGSS